LSPPSVLPCRGFLSAITAIEVFTVTLARGVHTVLPYGTRLDQDILKKCSFIGTPPIVLVCDTVLGLPRIGSKLTEL
jgi:hypothetical protein